MSVDAYFNASSRRSVFLQKRSALACLIARLDMYFHTYYDFLLTIISKMYNHVAIWTNMRMELTFFLLHIGIFITSVQRLVLSCSMVFLLLRFVILYTSFFPDFCFPYIFRILYVLLALRLYLWDMRILVNFFSYFQSII